VPGHTRRDQRAFTGCQPESPFGGRLVTQQQRVQCDCVSFAGAGKMITQILQPPVGDVKLRAGAAGRIDHDEGWGTLGCDAQGIQHIARPAGSHGGSRNRHDQHKRQAQRQRQPGRT
jgi:hypothetical protein